MTIHNPTTPCAWANTLSRMWGARFPVGIRQIASEYTAVRFEDPIRKIAEADIDTFEGALLPFKKRPGWAILYNPNIRSAGRINFTLAHELGHYLVHRADRPTGFERGQSEVLGVALTPALKKIEREADQFASYLLMPLDDFRDQVRYQTMSFDLLIHCAERYGVSITAAALKWLEATADCAALVVAKNGYVLWCRRSNEGQLAGLFFRRGMELPASSVAANARINTASHTLDLPPGVWGPRAVREIAIFSDAYEMTISLLIFEKRDRIRPDTAENHSEDLFERFSRGL